MPVILWLFFFCNIKVQLSMLFHNVSCSLHAFLFSGLIVQVRANAGQTRRHHRHQLGWKFCHKLCRMSDTILFMSTKYTVTFISTFLPLHLTQVSSRLSSQKVSDERLNRLFSLSLSLDLSSTESMYSASRTSITDWQSEKDGSPKNFPHYEFTIGLGKSPPPQ